jgi:hypothetical protein
MNNTITNSICCDILLPLTNYKRFIHLINKACDNTQWLRHSFVVITDGISAEDEHAMKEWYEETKKTKPMPDVTIIHANKYIIGNISKLYNFAILKSYSPFVYFQNENDELPINIDKSIFKLYNDDNIDILIGKCETFLKDRTPIEIFPLTNIDGKFLYDCKKAMKLFPSYAHPLSSVMKRSVFAKEPYFIENKNFSELAYYDFILRCLDNDDINIEFVPYSIKLSNRQSKTAVIIGVKIRQKLVEDIQLWLTDKPENKYKEFQKEILDLLAKGELVTFKEIDSRIEDYLDNEK